MINALNKPVAVFWISVLVLWLNFSGHILSTLPLKKYLDAEFPSERYVFSRLVYDLKHGTEAMGGFMLHYKHVDDLYKSVDREDYAAFKARLEAGDDQAGIYLSHYGLQDDLVFPLWQGLEWIKGKALDKARPESRWHKRLQTLDYYYYNLISQTLVSLINALVIGLILLWAARQFSPRHAWLALLFIVLFQPVLSFYGRSLWWMMWSWFLPFVIVLYGTYRGGSYHKNLSVLMALCVGVAAGLAVCVRTLMGYEFVAPAMVAAMVPIVFYAVYQNWGLWPWFKTSFVVGSLCLAGALAGLYMHYHALESYGADPLKVIEGRYQMRAYGGEAMSVKHGEILQSTQASFLGVLGGYLISGKELALPQIIMMAPFLWWLQTYLRKGRRRMEQTARRLHDAFIGSIALSFMGGVSMLAILKGHAYIHGYDIVIWSIPLNIVLLVFYAVRIIGLDKAK